MPKNDINLLGKKTFDIILSKPDDSTGIDYELTESRFNAEWLKEIREEMPDSFEDDSFDSLLNNYISSLGFEKISKKDAPKRDKEIAQFKKLMQLPEYQAELAKYRNLGIYFNEVQESTVEAEKKYPDCVLHKLAAINNSTSDIKEHIKTRIGLGKLGLAEQFNENELVSAADLLRKHVKYLIESSARWITKEYAKISSTSNREVDDEFKQSILIVYSGITQLTKQFNIPLQEIDIDMEAFKKIIPEAGEFMTKYNNMPIEEAIKNLETLNNK